MNRIKCYLLFPVLFLIGVHASFAQGGPAFGVYGSVGPGSGAPILPDELRVQLNQNQGLDGDVQFYKINYRTPTIDLRGIQKLTNLDIPESIVINPPKLSAFDHAVTLVGITGAPDDIKIIIWLAGNYYYDDMTFFIDSDQDRDFTNDVRPIKMSAGDEPKEIELLVGGVPTKMFLNSLKPIKKTKKPVARIENQFSMTILAGVGSGQLDYSFQDLTLGYPTWYSVNTSEKNLGISFAYDFKKFAFGASLIGQNNFFYTSLLTVQEGEPFYRNSGGGVDVTLADNFNRPILVQDIEEFINDDIHPDNKLQWSVFALYKYQLSRTIDIQPLVRFGRVSYFNGEYVRHFDTPTEVYDMPDSFFYAYGMRMEFTVGVSKGFYIEYIRDHLTWKPSDFLRNNPYSDYESTFNIGKFNLGYRFALN